MVSYSFAKFLAYYELTERITEIAKDDVPHSRWNQHVL